MDQTAARYKLRNAIKNNKKPVVFWIGAGASKWCGYPLWAELADEMHSSFLAEESSYNKQHASNLLAQKNFPDFFKLCKATNPQEYNALLSAQFETKDPPPVYRRFVSYLNAFKPLHILTTNVDEALEHHLPDANTLQRSDIERCMPLIQEKKPFICKLHGSISDIESLVFTTSEYEELEQDKKYLTLLQEIFSTCIVVFVGYSLADQYAIDRIMNSSEIRSLFGSGPHFIFTTESKNTLPPSVYPLHYPIDVHGDHRSVLQLIELVKAATEERRNAEINVKDPAPPSSSKTTYYLPEIVAFGTWKTAQTLGAESPDGKFAQMIVGQGFTQEELPKTLLTSLHDVVVGLICFDEVTIKINALEKLASLISPDFTTRLIVDGIVRLIHQQSEPAMMFDDPKSVVGNQGMITLQSAKSQSPTLTNTPMSKEEFVRRAIKPSTGKEEDAEKLLEKIMPNVISISAESLAATSPLARSALSHPPIRSLLGFSEGISVSQIPRWLMFPAQRLSYSILESIICKELNATACKVAFGGEKLLSSVFSITTAGERMDDMASYVITGKYKTDLGSMVRHNPDLLPAILKFRESAAGIAFRKEVGEQLVANEGSEFESSINGVIKHHFSIEFLEKTHQQFRELLMPDKRDLPALFNHPADGDDSIVKWKDQSRRILEAHCHQHNIGPYAPCPCGSTDKLKFCCQKALANT